jgi:exopolysaccharide biosynthesis protein
MSVTVILNIRKEYDMKKRKTSFLILLLAAIIWLSPASITEAANIQLPEKIYERVTETPVSPGAVHENLQRFTSSGWWNINVLRVDLTDRFTSVGSLFNPSGLSSRDSVGGMIEKKSAVAGINGDFYNFQPIPTSLGALIDNGKILSSPNHLPVFYLENQEAYIDYFTTKIVLTNWRTGYQMPVTTINKVSTNFDTIMLLNSDWGTKSIGNKFHANLTEFLVMNGIIVDKRTGGAAFDIPQDNSSYIIASRSSWLNDFQMGDTVQLDVSIFPDFQRLQFAIGAGSIILKDGQVVNTNLNVAGNHPRTGIGISKDKTEVILVTIDGRDSSFKGISQEMLGALLRDLGAWNGVNMDGGGSTTMAIKPNGETKSTVVNKPSEGSQRLVVNGVGVFSSAPSGKAERIEITADKPSIFSGESLGLTMKVYDEYHNLAATNPSDVRWSVSGAEGRVNGGRFIAEGSGVAEVKATYQGVSGTIEIRVLSPVEEIVTPTDRFNVAVGGSRSIGKLIGVDKTGFSGELSYSNVSIIVSGKIGEVRDGVFYASRNVGSGAIIIKSGNAMKTILVSVGSQIMPVNSFEDASKYSFSGYPTAVTGSASPSTEAKDGNSSIELNYNFSLGDGTRAAYINFNNSADGILLPGSPARIGLWVFGDGSGTWLRGTLVDAVGKSHVVDFSKAIDFTGWKQLEAVVPDGVTYPASLQRIYVAEVNDQRFPIGRILIDGLLAHTPTPYDAGAGAVDTRVVDPLDKAPISGTRIAIYTEPSISGNTLFSRVVTSDRLVGLTERLKGTRLGVQIGNMSPIFKSKVSHGSTLSGGTAYGSFREGEIAVITLQANSDGIRGQDSSQWPKLLKDLKDGREKNLVLVLNRKVSNFTDTMESALLHELLVEAADNGRNVFLVQSGSSNTVHLRDGVRYVEITGTKASTPSELSAFAYFEISMDGSSISYQLVKPFGL